MSPDSGGASLRSVRWAVAGADVATLVLFVVIGRASHHHGESVGGFVSTVWPFAAGLAAGWMATRTSRPAATATGVLVCGLTVVLGMLLRVVSGQGTAPPFVGVAFAFMGLGMIGGRAALRHQTRRLAARPRS